MTFTKRFHKTGYAAFFTLFCSLLLAAVFSVQTAQADEEAYKNLKLFSQVIEIIENNYVDEVKTEDLISGAIQGMVQTLDPHSEFMPPESYKDLKESTKGEFGGIGIQISMKDGYVTVIAPIMGTPGFRAGIQAGDVIVAVDGESTLDMKLTEAVKKMRGEKGTYVTLSIYRKGMKKAKDYKILRDIIEVASVHETSLAPHFGYVRITNFTESTETDLLEAIEGLRQDEQELSGLILDLRNNPGGLLHQAISVSDVFLSKGVIVSHKGRRATSSQEYHASPSRRDVKCPMVVLINGGSASASEIVAGALQDHRRAVLLGTTSFGKGSVQTVEPLRDGYALKLTIARYYTPSGRSIQAEGIVPDIIVKAGFDKKKKDDKDDEENSEFVYLKEKDLKNHLDAESDAGEEEQGQEETADDQEQELDIPSETPKEEVKTGEPVGPEQDPTKIFGYLDVDQLLKDHQIKRALDILKGYSLLSGLEK
ncbi:S41 family peptidase [Desulfatibacillum aliphaticivorans]|uniref:S41 family peptidase n=1 Tax=Desulfatibacillum aliphaticivorans TaxID=218208 RepID=UPI00041C28B4|nr:S41 family peptidase [Desulfatibacillum aliphaticivorans]